MVHLARLATTGAPQQAGSTPSPRLRQAAVEFEANFLQELLKPMKQDPLFADNNGSAGDDGETGGSLGTIDSLGTQAMAEALASAGGLGIARQILAKMAPLEAANDAAKVAANAASAAGKEANAAGKEANGAASPQSREWRPLPARSMFAR